ncbi:MAG TPA: GspH/FimT family pseudopilin [Gammaproteobacteria bacterium]|nr:GspH/FimT family pseudopilin [Gammaproteobacteria bacterium]
MQNHRGFTIVELMITVAIAAILVTVAVPAMRSFVQQGQVVSVANELSGAITKIQDRAIGIGACMCPTTNASVATPVCAASSNWETGWIGFTDANSNCVIDGADTLIKVWDGTSYAGQLTVRTVSPTINGSNRIFFNTFGEPRLANGSSQLGVFRVCDPRGLVGVTNSTTAVGVVLSASGSARTTRNIAQILACP